jgi:hypothetical protein
VWEVHFRVVFVHQVSTQEAENFDEELKSLGVGSRAG